MIEHEIKHLICAFSADSTELHWRWIMLRNKRVPDLAAVRTVKIKRRRFVVAPGGCIDSCFCDVKKHANLIVTLVLCVERIQHGTLLRISHHLVYIA